MIEERNFAQEFVMWAVGIFTFAVTALGWEWTENDFAWYPGYQNLLGITIIALIGGAYLVSLVKRSDCGITRRGIAYGAYAGTVFWTVITTVSIALGGN